MVTLRDKFYGCILGAHIGSSMGATVEGWTYQQIQAKYGLLKTLEPHICYDNGWMRLPGTTEDGIERQKLMITAIIEKQDRVNAEDVRNAWIAHIKPEAPGMVSEKFEAVLLQMAKSGIPARDLGRYCDYAGLNAFSRACHPLGLINAGDKDGARDDVFEVGQLYQSTNSRGLKWAVVTAVAIAEATRPGATIDSVLGAILDYADPEVVGRELERELEGSRHCKDITELRAYFDGVYSGVGMPYAMSSANEVVTKAVCIVQMVKANLFDAMVAGVNMGRDTDCVTAIAAGISGALTGSNTMPESYIALTDEATKQNPYTNSKRTLRETADGLYEANRSKLNRWNGLYRLMYNA